MLSDITDGLKRLVFQFKGSEKFEEFITAFLTQFEELSEINSDLELLRYLETSFGVQLDGIGEIVGLERPLKIVSKAGLFGFLLDTKAKGFGDINNFDIGGNFWDGINEYVLIGDDLYRLLIRAKIIKNQTAMTVDDTTRLISFMFGGVEVRYFLLVNLAPRYDIGKILDPFEESLLPDLPVLIAMGEIEYYSSYSDVSPFVFEGDVSPLGQGFGDINNPAIGGNLAKIITNI